MNDTMNAPLPSTGSYLFTIVRLAVLFILLCGVVYPLVCTGIAQLAMPEQANGSLIKNEAGQVIGSELIGQNFTDPKYFHGRVSSIDYNGAASGSGNYAPSNPDLLQRTKDSIEAWKKENPDVPVNQLPVDLMTNSGSGLDPHITPASAKVQVPRISKQTGIPADKLNALVEEHTDGRELGLFGEERVNVLELNIALSAMLK